MKNDEARSLIEASGITVENVTSDQLERLHACINKKMIESGNYCDTYRMDKTVGPYMTCSTEQWASREAVSFNRDGFIGFCGWADSKNTKPILDGVVDWLAIEIKERNANNENSNAFVITEEIMVDMAAAAKVPFRMLWGRDQIKPDA